MVYCTPWTFPWVDRVHSRPSTTKKALPESSLRLNFNKSTALCIDQIYRPLEFSTWHRWCAAELFKMNVMTRILTHNCIKSKGGLTWSSAARLRIIIGQLGLRVLSLISFHCQLKPQNKCWLCAFLQLYTLCCTATTRQHPDVTFKTSSGVTQKLKHYLTMKDMVSKTCWNWNIWGKWKILIILFC